MEAIKINNRPAMSEHIESKNDRRKERIAQEIIFEDKSMRKGNIKHFKLANGAYQAKYYGAPVHYFNKKEGVYREIDNEFEYRAANTRRKNDFDGFENKYNNVKVKLSKDLANNRLARIKKDRHTLNIFINGKKRGMDAGFELNDCEGRLVEHQWSRHSHERYKPEDVHDEIKPGEIRYDSFAPGTDLQYILNGAMLKENIIIHGKSDNYEFCFTLEAENLKTELAPDGKSVLFKSALEAEQNTKPVFTLPAAFMKDAKNVLSKNVNYEMRHTENNKILLTVKADAEWINSSEREFPVIIDPVIIFGSIESSSCTETGNFYYYGFDLIGKDSYYGKARTYVGVYNQIAGEILSARYSTGILDYWSSQSPAPNIKVYKVTEDIPYGLDWYNKPNPSVKLCDSYAGNGYLYDITVDLTKIYSDNDFKGFVMMLDDENIGQDHMFVIDGWYFGGGTLAVEYIPEGSVKEGYCHTNALNRAGGGSINLLTGRQTFTHEDLAVGYTELPIRLYHLFNSDFKNSQNIGVPSGMTSIPSIYCGNGWKTNYHQYIREIPGWGGNGIPKYIYYGAGGDPAFIIQEGAKYVFENDKTTEYKPAYRTIYDKFGNTMSFDVSGRLTCQRNANGETLNINYSSDKLVEINNYEPNRGGSYTYYSVQFEYNAGGGKLSKIRFESDDQNRTNELYYNYNGNELAEIVYENPVGGDRTAFTYNSGNISSVTDPTGHKLTYSFNGGSITVAESTTTVKISDAGIQSIAGAPRVKPATTIEPGYRARVTTNSETTVYGFNRKGKFLFAHKDDRKEFTFAKVEDNSVLKASVSKALSNYASGNPVTNFAITGNPRNEMKEIRIYPIDSGRGYVVSCFAKGNADTLSGYGGRNNKFRLKASLCNSSGTVIYGSDYWDYDFLDLEWQLGVVCLDGARSANKPATHIKVELDYSHNAGTVYFDNLSVVQSTYEQSETAGISSKTYKGDGSETKWDYDGKKNVIYNQYTNEYGTSYRSDYVYNANSRPTSIKNLNYGYTDSYTYVGNNDQYGFYEEVQEKRSIPGSARVISRNTYKNQCFEKYTEDIYEDGNLKQSVNINASTGLAGETFDGACNAEYAYDAKGELQTMSSNGSSHQYYYKKFLLTKVVSNGNTVNFVYDGFGELIETWVNNQLIKSYEYRNDCNYSTAGTDEALYNYEQTTLNGYTVKTVYGKDGKPLKKYEKTGNGAFAQTVNMQYGADGRPQSITDTTTGAALTQAFSCNPGGSVNTVTYSGARTGSISRRYNASGQVTNKTVNFGSPLTYTYDTCGPSANAPAYLYVNGNDFMEEYEYDGFGRLAAKSAGSCNWLTPLREEYTYCINSRLISNIHYDNYYYSYDADYTYDNRSNIASYTAQENYYRYHYDSLNRLKREDNGAMYTTRVWDYDAEGNITGVTEYPFTTGANPANGTYYPYTYTNGRLTSALGHAFGSYDSLGNPCNYKGKVLQWERGNRLKAYGNNISYTYDAGGIRQSKTVNGVTTAYYTEGGRIHKEVRGGQEIQYIYGKDGIAGMMYNYEMYYFLKNLQGDVIGICRLNSWDNYGEMVVRYLYDAWGNCIVDDPYGTGIGAINPFRYRGYYRDEETGLYYLQSRYYDPEVGRFINADNVNYIAPTMLNGLNLYAYCGNNPVNKIDPTGRAWWWAILPVAIGLWQDLKNFNIHNTDEQVVLDSNYFSYYKGQLVIRHHIDNPEVTSCAIFGIIFLNANETDPNTVKHEWGHTQQEKMIGTINYIIRIAIPSLMNRDPRNYYSNPWEYTADLLGGVDRGNYLDGANQAGGTYLLDSLFYWQRYVITFLSKYFKPLPVKSIW